VGAPGGAATVNVAPAAAIAAAVSGGSAYAISQSTTKPTRPGKPVPK